jgi:hypothetical protein
VQRRCRIESIFAVKSTGALFTVGMLGSGSGKSIEPARAFDIGGGDKAHDSHHIWILVP